MASLLVVVFFFFFFFFLIQAGFHFPSTGLLVVINWQVDTKRLILFSIPRRHQNFSVSFYRLYTWENLCFFFFSLPKKISMTLQKFSYVFNNIGLLSFSLCFSFSVSCYCECSLIRPQKGYHKTSIGEIIAILITHAHN